MAAFSTRARGTAAPRDPTGVTGCRSLLETCAVMPRIEGASDGWDSPCGGTGNTSFAPRLWKPQHSRFAELLASEQPPCPSSRRWQPSSDLSRGAPPIVVDSLRQPDVDLDELTFREHQRVRFACQLKTEQPTIALCGALGSPVIVWLQTSREPVSAAVP